MRSQLATLLSGAASGLSIHREARLAVCKPRWSLAADECCLNATLRGYMQREAATRMRVGTTSLRETVS